MTSFTSKLGDDFLRVPKLASDGKNWVVYKDRLILSVQARALGGHLDGTTAKPTEPAITQAPADRALTDEEKQKITTYQDDLKEWFQKEAIVSQQIASTIPDSLYLKIRGKPTVKEAWDLLRSDFEKRSRMFMVDLRRRLQDERCDDNANIRTHFDTMRTMREDLAALGDDLGDEDFSAMVIGSLPRSYDSYLSAVTAALSVLGTKLGPDALMLSVIDEFDRRTVKTRQSKDKGKDVAFHAESGSKKVWKGGKGSKKSVECFNCHKKGHVKADCWAKGGGKEGQGPRGRKAEKSEKSNGESANIVEDEDGVWMAAVDDSSDADDEGEWAGCFGEEDDEDLWFSNDKSDSPQSPTPSFDFINPSDLFDKSGDFSEDFEGMPDLKDVTDSSDDEENDAPSLLEISDKEDDSEVGDFSEESLDKEGNRLVEDLGGDAFTRTFTCAMLVTAGRTDEGVETELYDSGASRHMTAYRNRLVNFVSIAPKSIAAADKRYFQATGKGSLRIKIPNGKTTTSILLTDVLYCPQMGLTLVSISKLADAGFHSHFASRCKIFDAKDKVIGDVPRRNGLYRVDHSTDIGGEVGGMAAEVVTIEELHRRMGHIAPEAARRLVSEDAIEGLELDKSSELKTCDSCEYAKATRKPIRKIRATPRASEFGEEINSDLWGPSPVQTPGKKEYYAAFTDDHTRWSHLELLHTKDEAFKAYTDFEAWAKTQFRVRSFKRLRTDRGGEYLSKKFNDHLAANGTKRLLTTHDTPEYNGISERLNRVLLERTRAFLHSSGLPKFLWGEAVKHAVWLKNRTPTRALPIGKTPFEMLYGKKPNLAGLREWGAKVWVHDTSGTKLDGRSRIGRWIGFEEASNAHRIYWPDNRSVTVERSIKFDNNDLLIPRTLPSKGEKEDTGRQSSQDSNTTPTNPIDHNAPQQEAAEQIPTEQIPENQNPPQNNYLGADFNRADVEEPAARSQRIRKPSAYVKQLQSGSFTSDGRRNQPFFPKGLQTANEWEADTGAAGMDEDIVEIGCMEFAMAAVIAEAEALDPATLEEARRRKDWSKWDLAIKAELEALKKAGTWGVIERPRGRNVVACKWVLHIKKDATGRIERYKARLVAKGFTQVYGVDYYETFAPVAKLASIRTILAIAARNNWPIDMFDFHSAFLNGQLSDDEEVFMEQPPGYEESDPKKYCVKLYKSIYGLKQAGRKWYEVVCRMLADLGFKKCEADPAIFYIHAGKDILILAIHVDDCTITGSSDDLIQNYKLKIKSKYDLTDLGPIHWLLGIKITRDRENRTIALSQSSYIDSLLRRFNFTDLKPFSTPMDPNIRYSKNQCPQTLEQAAEMRHIPYREAVGSLLYLAVATRPDIAFPIGILSQYVDNPGRIHWEGVKHVFRYLAGTRDWVLIYGTKVKGLEGFTDADGATQEHRHAITGYAFLIDGGAVSWSSKKQEIVTLSTAESEYVAATHAAKEAIWLRRFIGEVFQPLTNPIPLYSDSQAAIALTRDGSYHARTKHIDIRYHFIRFVVNNGTINLIYCPTDDMVADTLTKALPNIKAKHFAAALGLQST